MLMKFIAYGAFLSSVLGAADPHAEDYADEIAAINRVYSDNYQAQMTAARAASSRSLSFANSKRATNAHEQEMIQESIQLEEERQARAQDPAQQGLLARIGSFFGSTGTAPRAPVVAPQVPHPVARPPSAPVDVAPAVARPARPVNRLVHQETPIKYNRIPLSRGLTKWEIPCQLKQNRDAACTLFCTWLLDNLSQRFATVDPRDSLTPTLAEGMTGDAFDWGEQEFQRRYSTTGNGRVDPDELSQFAPELLLIRNNTYNGAVMRCPVPRGQLAQFLDGNVRDSITHALSTYRVVIIVSPNSATTGFVQQGNSTNGFYVDTHTLAGNLKHTTDKNAGEITYGSIKSLQEYLIERFENDTQGDILELYGFGRL